MNEIIFTPAEFVAILNQTLEVSFPLVVIEGELANFRISKGRWVYFELKDDEASIKCFGTVYNLPGPLEDGLSVRISGAPRLHSRFGFSVNIQSIQPVGEGALKKAADLLARKLTLEGIFDPEKKRPLPYCPAKIGLITAADSAAAADFVKILNERWGGVEVLLIDSYVQGDQAPQQITDAMTEFNQHYPQLEAVVITRGGGSPDDLAAFSDERVVRAVSASRIPTLVAIGHEIDVSLAELAADARASTPSNAAQMLVPDKKQQLEYLNVQKLALARQLQDIRKAHSLKLHNLENSIFNGLERALSAEIRHLQSLQRLVALYDPLGALKRGYALVSHHGKHIRSIKQLKTGDKLSVRLSDGTIQANATRVLRP